MNHFIYVFLLLSIVTCGQISALNEPVNAGSNIESIFQRHLPSQIFEYVTKNDLVDLTEYETITEKQNLEGLDRLIIDLNTLKDEKCIYITFWPENTNADDNFGGFQACYKNGKMVGNAIFDAYGRDYVADGPFSEEDEKKMVNWILLLMKGGVAKVKEEYQID